MMKYLTVTGKININKYGKKELLYDEEILKFINELNFNISVLSFNKKIDLRSLKKSNGLILTGGGDIYKYSKKKLINIEITSKSNYLIIFIRQTNLFWQFAEDIN